MSEDDRTPPPPRCPICGKPRVQKYRPFCSKRCAEIDLGRWLGEVYTIPAAEAGEDERVAPPQQISPGHGED